MTVEEAGPDPVRLAAAIHRQLGASAGPVPIHAIATALDIVEIREAQITSFEGALVMPVDRNIGAIAVNAASPRRRRRFTIAHELGHFLSPHHRPVNGVSFACSTRDLGSGWKGPANDLDRHLVQEAEANRFAIELLAPPRLMRRALTGIPDLAKIVAVSEALDLSREAIARRTVELHPEPIAVLFSRDGRLRYAERAGAFPFIALSQGDRLPTLPAAAGADGLSAHEDADPRDWFAGRTAPSLVVQTLYQDEGYAITLLAVDRSGDDGDD